MGKDKKIQNKCNFEKWFNNYTKEDYNAAYCCEFNQCDMKESFESRQLEIDKLREENEKLRECGKWFANCLENFIPFNGHSKVGLDPTMYQTLSHIGDLGLYTKYKEYLKQIDI